MSEMESTLWKVRRAFVEAGEGKDDDPDYWLNLIEAQLKEAREHRADGKLVGIRGSVTAELADLIGISFQALNAFGVEDPGAFVVQRHIERVLPRVQYLIARDAPNNGFKSDLPEGGDSK